MSNPFVRWGFFPALYAVSILPVLIVCLYVVARVERVLGCGWACEIGGLLALLVFGAPVFLLFSIGLAHLERLRPPSFFDHLRHGIMLYVIMAVLGYILVASYDMQGLDGAWWGLGVALFLLAAYANLLDALVVYVARRRSMSQSS